MAETVDALEVEIRSRAEDAARSISELATSVTDFGKSVRRYINNLSDFGAALEQIAKAAQGLKQVRGLGSILEKVAPVVAKSQAQNAVKKAATATQAKDWRRQMFPNEEEYNRIFNTRAYYKGQYPAKWRREENDSAYRMDRGDVSMRAVRELTRSLFGEHGIQKTRAFTMKDVDSAIAGIRTGMGRVEGSNSAWMTPEAFAQAKELAEQIHTFANAGYDSSTIDAVRTLGGKLKLDSEVQDELVGELNAEFRRFGISFSKSSGMSVEDIRAIRDVSDYYHENDPEAAAARTLGLDTSDSMNTLIWRMRNVMGSGNDKDPMNPHSESAILTELLSRIVDLPAKNERVMTDPEAMQAQEALRAAFESSQAAGAEEVKQEASAAAMEIHDAVKTTVRMDADAAVEGMKGGEAQTAADYNPFGTHEYRTFNPETGKFDIVGQAENPVPASWSEPITPETPDAIARATEEAKELEERAMAAKRQIMELMDALNSPAPQTNWSLAIDRMLGIGAEVKSAQESASAFQGLAHGVADAGGGIGDLSAGAADASGNMGLMSDEAEAAAESSFSLGDAMSAAGEAIGAVGKMIGKSLLGQLARVAKMRALRYVVRAVVSSFKEGLQNLYQYSSKMNGHFAGAMDTFASKSMLVKNSLATALGPAIEALMPVFVRLVGWINAASNALAQFFAKINGQTEWTRAVETAEQWGDTATGAVTDADKAVKDLLADWDELNIIQSETGNNGGGGGGKTQTDYSSMFEETAKFDDWVEYFDEIRGIVDAIAIGIAGWFVLSKVQNFLNMIGLAGAKVDGIFDAIKLGVAGAVLLTVGFNLAEAAGKDIATNGITAGNVGESLLAMVAVSLGGYMIGAGFAKAVAAAAGIALGGAAVVGGIIGLAAVIGMELYSYVHTRDKNAYEKAKEWVFANAFNYDIETQLNVVKTTVDASSAARANARIRMVELFGTFDAVRLGINTSLTLSRVKAQLGDENSGLIHDINEEASAAQNVIELFYTMNPKKDKNGKDTSIEALRGTSAAWETVEQWYKEKGEALGRLFVENEKGEIIVSDVELANEIINAVDEATRIAYRALKHSEIAIDLQVALTEGSDADIAKAYNDYKEKIKEAGESEYKEVVASQTALVSYLEGIYAAEKDEKKKAKIFEELAQEKDKLQSLVATGAMTTWVKEYVEVMTTYGDEAIAKHFLSQEFDELFGDRTWTEDMYERLIGDSGSFEGALENLFMETMKRNGLEGLLYFDIDDLLTDEQKKAIEEAKAWLDQLNADKDAERQAAEDRARAEAEEQERLAREEAEENTRWMQQWSGGTAYERDTTGDTMTGISHEIEEAAEDTADAAEASEEAAVAAKDAAEAVQEAAATGNPFGLDDAEMNALEDYLEEWRRTEKLGGNTSTADLYDAEQKLEDELKDKPGMFDQILDKIEEYFLHNPGWEDQNVTPEQLLAMALGGGETGININAAASGMALDDTVAAAGNTLMNGQNLMNTALAAISGYMQSVEENTRKTAGKKWTVNISPTPAFGNLMGRSADAWSIVTGDIG